MAAKPSNHGMRTGGDVNRAGPVKGAVPRVGQAASPTSSGSKTRGVGARSGPSSPHTPTSVGAPTNPRSTAPAARRATSSSSREPMSSTKSAPSPVGKSSPAPRAVGKVTTAAKQPSRTISEQKAAEIERETCGQRENPEWFKWRSNRITASVAHKVSHSKFVNGKSNEVPQSYLKSIVGQGSNVLTPPMKWGIDNEPVALQQYEKLKSKEMKREVEVRPCGLFIDPAKNWLAASPDGVVQDKKTKTTVGLVEVKCPYKHRNHTVTEACEDRYFCLENKDHFQLKKNHPYFTQIQCQMAVAGVNKADLVVYTNRDTAIVPVEFDADFWQETVEKLENFYTRAVLPEIQRQNPAFAREE
ncbi:uncharacterized protein LOC116979827 [Amblyraja radiata]|uniref:uncharacterized protein LOC116979827 n=1 Tax=Amblyraja radiata TaxID=386614 RepID=UPI001402D755|nr:uncharacterized protein LOC116979827 [Amblyraja radiata]